MDEIKNEKLDLAGPMEETVEEPLRDIKFSGNQLTEIDIEKELNKDEDIQSVFSQPVRHSNPALSPAADNQLPQFSGLVIGRILDVYENHNNGTTETVINIDYPGNPINQSMQAKSTVTVNVRDINKNAAIMFDNGDPIKPVIMGLIQDAVTNVNSETRTSDDQKNKVNVKLDGERITFSAEKEIELKCGKASITLTKAGKVLIRGDYVLSRSTGVNSVKGGSVQIN